MRLASLLCVLAACERPTSPDGARSPGVSLTPPAVDAALVDAVPPDAPPAYPRFGDAGFEGLSEDDMVAFETMRRTFPGLVVWGTDREHLILRAPPGDAVVKVDTEDGRLHRIWIKGPEIETTHGPRVGDRFADVLRVPGRRCETIWDGGESGAKAIVRCWIGEAPARTRYVTFPSPILGFSEDAPRPPSSGAALERWIEASDQRVEVILWRREPDRWGS